jgi:hypothetical protein
LWFRCFGQRKEEWKMQLDLGTRLLLVLVAVLVSVIAGMADGMLGRSDGDQTSLNIRRGARTFGVSLTLVVMVLVSLGLLS